MDCGQLADTDRCGESRRTATRVRRGATCLSSSSHLALRPYSNPANPVVLPPGRAKLATKPAPTGSITPANTIGTARVACCNAATVGKVVAKRTSGVSATNSVAFFRLRSASLIPHRMWICALRPTAQPASCSPCRNAATRACPSRSSAGMFMSTPMRRIGSRCCARAASGHATAEPPSSVMNSGAASFDHLVGEQQERLRDFQAQRLRGFEIDHQFESGWNLNRQVGRACTLENLIDHYGRLPV